MTMTASPELFGTANEPGPDWDAELAALTASVIPTERLGDNPTAVAVWDTIVPLLNGSERSQRFDELVPVTPVLHVPEYALPADLRNTGHQLYFATDGDMPTGAYKFRGVVSALLEQLEQADDLRETVAASTGNHAAAMALASVILGLNSVVYMPEGAVPAKVANTTQYGADVVFKPNLEQAVKAAEEHDKRPGSAFIHPYDRLAVIAGQGTMAARLPQQMAAHGVDLSLQSADLYEPAGGGGVATGNSVASKALLPNVRLHVVQAENADALVAHLQDRRFDIDTFNPAVDGAAVLHPGAIARAVLSTPGFVHGRHVVSRGQIGEAMAVTSRFTDLCEPAGAMALAAALAAMRSDRNGKSIKIVHGTGINTTSTKVHQFATEAYRAGLLSGEDAVKLISHASIDARRRPNEVEERGLALAALRYAQAPVRHGSRVASGGWN